MNPIEKKMAERLNTLLNDIKQEDLFEAYGEPFYEAFREEVTEAGFPDDVTISYLDLTIDIKPNYTGEELADEFVNSHYEIETMEELDAIDDEVLKSHLMQDFEKFDMTLTINDTPDEYLDRFPTHSYIVKALETGLDEHQFTEMVLQQGENNDILMERVNDILDEEGIERNSIRISELSIEIFNIEPMTSYDDIASSIMDDVHGESVKAYLEGQFIKDMLDEDMYNFEVNIRDFDDIAHDTY